MEAEIVFRAHGNVKQVEAFKYWLDDETTEIAYGGSKGCTHPSSEVRTKKGIKQIKDIQESDIVLTTNEKTNAPEWKPVLSVKKYLNPSASEYHKMIRFVLKGGNQISLTTNHEIYNEGAWVPIGEYARRILDIYSSDKWEVFSVNPRTSHVDYEAWTNEALYFKWHIDEEGLQEGELGLHGRSPVLPSSSVGCFSFYPKSREQASGESHRLQSGEQSLGQLRVGYGQRECGSFEREGSSAFWQQKRGSQQQHDTNRRSGTGDSEAIQEEDCNEGDVRGGVRGKSSHNKRYNISQELDPHLVESVDFFLYQGYVYDLHVCENHNYCVTNDNIIIHNSGKSFLGCSLILGDALLYPNTHYFIARKTLSDLRKFTTTSIKEVLDGWGIPSSMYHYNGQDNYYLFSNGSRVYFIGCEPRPSDPTFARLGSIQMTRGWVEESGEVEEAAKNALAACIGRWKNKEYGLKAKLLLTCNPAKNFLYRDFYEPFKNGILPASKKFIQALPSDNKSIGEEYIEHLRQTLNYSERQRLLEGNWEYDDDPSVLIDIEAINSIFLNSGVAPGKRCMTVDVARQGGARIVCIVWNGYRGIVHSWSKVELPESLKRIEELRLEADIPPKDVLIDGDGIGPGIGDYGRYSMFRNNFPAFPNANPKLRRDGNGKIVKENFDNRKSQCGFYMADLICERNVFLMLKNGADKDLIVQELEQVRKKHVDSDLKNALVPKEEVTKRLGRSPDFWDAILMRKAFDYSGGKIRISHRNGNDINREALFGPKRRYEKDY